MASFVLLNDGSSFLVLNDGSSKVILNGEVGTRGFGGIRQRLFRQPTPEQIEHQEWARMITVKPTLTRTNDISFKGIPLLRQYLLRIISAKPTVTSDETLPLFLKPVKEKHVHIASFACKLNKLLFDHDMTIHVDARPKMDDYFITDIHGKTLNGMGIIRKAMALNMVRKFSFRESSQNWESADTLSDLDKRIKRLNDKIDDLERDLIPREKDFVHPSSFVGTVTYTPESNTMEIAMNGKVYGFCGVPERIFDEFEGSPSKGAFYNRSIRSQFNCG